MTHVVPFIDYLRLMDNIKASVINCDYKNLQSMTQKDIKQIQKEIIDIMERYNFDAIVYNPSEIIKSMVSVVRHHFSNYSALYLSRIWPPVVKKSNEFIPEIFNFFVEITKRLTTPQTFMKWISDGIFALTWSKVDPNYHTIAVGKGKVEGQPNSSVFLQVVATLNANVYNIVDNTMSRLEGITRIETDDSAGVVSFYNGSNKIFGLKLDDLSSLKFWPAITSHPTLRNNPFLCPPQGPYPSSFLNDFAKLLIKPDSPVSSAILACIYGDVDTIRSLLPMIYNIYHRYHSCMALFSLILITDLNKCEGRIAYLKSRRSLTYYLMEVIVDNVSGGYDEMFTNKLIKYINDRPNLDLRALNEDTKNVFFSTIKYIINSVTLIPNEIFLILAMIRSYSILVDNNRERVLNLIASVFTRHLIRTYVKKVFKGNKFAIPYQIVYHACKTIIHKRFFINAPPEWETKLADVFFPKIDIFLCSISEFPLVTTPPWKKITEHEKEMSIKAVIDYITYHFPQYMRRLEDFSIPTKLYPTTLGWQLAVAVSNMFANQGDQKELLNFYKNRKAKLLEPDDPVESDGDSDDDLILKGAKKKKLSIVPNLLVECPEEVIKKAPKIKKKVTYVYVNKKVYRNRDRPKKEAVTKSSKKKKE